MDYTLINNGRCAGVVGTKPEHDNWTLTPYLGGLVKEFWNGTEWVESATEQEIFEASQQNVNIDDVLIDLLSKQVTAMSDTEKNELLKNLLL